MKIFLVRHGEAAEQGLTPKGREESAKNGLLLKHFHPSLSAIYHSTKQRAEETAHIFHEILGHHIPLTEKEGLGPNDSPEGIVDEISRAKQNVMIVSHLPLLEKIASHLLYGEEHMLPFTFDPSSVICLEKESATRWRLIAMVSSRSFETIPTH